MTRKEALSIAIQALLETEQDEKAVEVLRTMREELPLNRWTEAAIRDSIEQFVMDHGRLPNAADFKKSRTLPPHTVIKNKYGANLSEWLRETYPDTQELQRKARTAATERFVREYHRLRPKSAAEFNRRRRDDCCCWFTVARYNETRTWRALLAKLDLPVFTKVAMPKKEREYYVQFEASLNEMQPVQKCVLQQMVREHDRTFWPANFRVVCKKNKRETAAEQLVLRYITDERMAYEGVNETEEQDADLNGKNETGLDWEGSELREKTCFMEAQGV